MFCKVCGKSSHEDNRFVKRKLLCRKHNEQMLKYGEIIDVTPSGITNKKCCDICGDLNSSKYYKWSRQDEYFGKILCNRHYLQLMRHGELMSIDREREISFERVCAVCGDTEHSRYYVWHGDGELHNKTLCGKHYGQMLKNNKIIDPLISEHFDRKKWSEKEKKLFEQYYKEGKSFKEISDLLERSIGSLNSMSVVLKLGEKYMRYNNPNFKAEYQDYDWCYDRYINKNMSHQEMADEAGCSLRVIQKWCSEIHQLHQWSFKREKRLSELQRQIILFGTLGDGHIDKRENQPMYIESHAIDEKDYLFWKYDMLKDLCNNEPVYIGEQYSTFNTDKKYLCQPSYRMITKIIDELKPIRDMSRIEKIKALNELGLSLHMLDDGSRSDCWQICLAEWTQEEIETYIKICKSNFNLECHQLSDKRYVIFTAISSKKIDEIILNNIPNHLDVIDKKILKNNKIKKCRFNKYIIKYDNEKIGLGAFCKEKHIKHEIGKIIFDTFDSEYVEESNFMRKYEEQYGQKIQ